MKNLMRTIKSLLVLLIASGVLIAHSGQRPAVKAKLVREVNDPGQPPSNNLIAIVGATLIDGRGGPVVTDAVVLIRGERIAAVGKRGSVNIPQGAETVDGHGLSMLPGLIDAHFHIDGDDSLPALFLSHGVTSLRDPGQWIEAYDGARKLSAPIPRLFLCGPHLDSPPPAYPADSYIVRDPEETRMAVNRFVDDGASAIKVYFRLPLSLIRVAVETSHARGVPVTAHLEIVDAGDAIRAGVDGIEHATSFGTALLPLRDAEKYRQAVLADNSARREGRYQVWNAIDLKSSRAKSIFKLIVDHGTVSLPTDKAGTVNWQVKRVHPATHLGADHNVLSRHAPDHRPAAMFGQAAAIERGSVEKVDPQLECPLCRGDSRGVVQLRVEITKRRRSESQNRDLKRCPAKHTPRHCSRRNQIGRFSSGPLPSHAGAPILGSPANNPIPVTIDPTNRPSMGEGLRGCSARQRFCHR